jgi:hypothetical protein
VQLSSSITWSRVKADRVAGHEVQVRRSGDMTECLTFFSRSRLIANRAGKISLKVAKDRHGGIGALNQKIGDFVFMPNGDRTTQVDFVEIIEPPFRPTALMQKIYDYLVKHPDASKSDLRGLAKAEFVDKAIECLISEGYISEKRGGLGRKNTYVILRKFNAKPGP